MTNLNFLLIGAGIGLLTSAPVGPVNIMTLRHAAAHGIREGVTVALGAVVADLLYAALAVFGVSAVTGFVTGHEGLIKLAGGALIFGFGWRVYRSRPHMDPQAGAASALTDMVAAFLLTLTNPGVILGFVAILGGLGTWRPQPGDTSGALFLLAGVATGALVWWSGLCWGVSHMSARVDSSWLARANHLAGALLMLFGVGIYADLLIRWLV